LGKKLNINAFSLLTCYRTLKQGKVGENAYTVFSPAIAFSIAS
jgi:hypothetical protein